ncbi:MAG: glycosyltransferase family 4 protein [Methylococcales bacterium]|nr:glycosyltransferase family 4 protein [Methylococcales bacterium]
MKVLFVASSLGSGGAERVLSIQANYFTEELGYDVTIATYNIAVDDFYKLNSQVKRVNFGVKNGNNLFTKVIKRINRVWRIRRMVQDINPDIVISLIVSTNIEVIFATLFTKTPVLAVEHSNYWAVKPVLHRALRIFAYKFSSKVVLLTTKDKLKYNEYLRNCEVISNPILLEDCISSEGLEKREKTILCVGRLNKIKQFDHIIFVFSKIIKNYPEWRLVVAGSGEELDGLRKYADQLGITESVDFLGNVVDISQLYIKSGVFVLCSSHEGFPMALGEAMFCGMPVVSYDCLTGPSEMIENQVTGILIEHNNKKDLERGIFSLIKDEEKRSFLGNNAKKRIEDFSVQKIGKKWKYLIESIVEKSGFK